MSGADWQANNAVPPRAGLVSVLATSTTAASQDLRLCGNQSLNATNNATEQPAGLPGHWVRFEAVTADCGIVLGPTSASVTGGNVPSLAASGVNATGACVRIPAGQYREFRLAQGVDVFLGYVASGAGQLIVTQVSR